jgi:hydroxyethylthiazole kinase-like uncharacterized protein yjeF
MRLCDGQFENCGEQEMTELLTAAQMRAIEQAAIASGEVTGLELMERAGRGVVEAIFEEWPELKATSHRAVVLCGPGNNGGDGFVVARLLKEWGWEVEVFLYGDPERMPPDARVNYELWVGMGEVRALTSESCEWTDKPAVLVDALFGIGLTRKLPEDLIDVFTILAGRKTPPYRRRFKKCIAIDVPSGLNSDTGDYLHLKSEGWLESDLTVTFTMEKIGHRISNGPYFSRRLVVKALGLHREEFLERGPFSQEPDDPRVELIDQRIYGKPHPFIRQASKYVGFHKYSHGHALILSGPSGRGGAARLAARGALRIGAGVVTVGCPPDATPENAARMDAVMLRGVADGLALEEALADPRINALCVGPGLGLDTRGRELVAVALESRGRPRATGADVGDVGRGLPRRSMVLDADALTILSQTPDLVAALHKGCVLTPHAGEFSRLFPDIAEKLAAPATKGPAYSKVDATREAAKRSGCVVLYKGPDTVIADPTGRCAINSAHYDRAAPWLATAGSGDVLAGFITGLLARGFSSFDAACTGAWLHVECALSFGPGLIAEDLPEELPKVFRALGL